MKTNDLAEFIKLPIVYMIGLMICISSCSSAGTQSRHGIRNHGRTTKCTEGLSSCFRGLKEKCCSCSCPKFFSWFKNIKWKCWEKDSSNSDLLSKETPIKIDPKEFEDQSVSEMDLPFGISSKEVDNLVTLFHNNKTTTHSLSTPQPTLNNNISNNMRIVVEDFDEVKTTDIQEEESEEEFESTNSGSNHEMEIQKPQPKMVGNNEEEEEEVELEDSSYSSSFSHDPNFPKTNIKLVYDPNDPKRSDYNQHVRQMVHRHSGKFKNPLVKKYKHEKIDPNTQTLTLGTIQQRQEYWDEMDRKNRNKNRKKEKKSSKPRSLMRGNYSMTTNVGYYLSNNRNEKRQSITNNQFQNQTNNNNINTFRVINPTPPKTKYRKRRRRSKTRKSLQNIPNRVERFEFAQENFNQTGMINNKSYKAKPFKGDFTQNNRYNINNINTTTNTQNNLKNNRKPMKHLQNQFITIPVQNEN